MTVLRQYHKAGVQFLLARISRLYQFRVKPHSPISNQLPISGTSAQQFASAIDAAALFHGLRIALGWHRLAYVY